MTTLAKTRTSATPILDGEKEFFQPSLAKVVSNVLAIILLLLALSLEVLRYLGIRPPQSLSNRVRSVVPVDWFFGMFGQGFESWLFFILIFAAAFYCVVAIHETGHLLAGLNLGFRFSSFSVGPLHWSRSDSGKMRVQFELKNLFRLGGGTEMYPQNEENLRQRLLLMVCAGPAATILTAAMFVTSWWVWPHGRSAPVYFYSIASFMFCSLMAIWASLWPSYREGADGARILMLLKPEGERYARSWFAAGKINQKLSAGESLEMLSEDLVESSAAVPDGSPDSLTSNALAYDWALVRDDLDLAATHLEHCLAAVGAAPKHLQEEWILEAAFFQGCNRKDPARTRLWLDRLGKKKLRNSLYGVIAESVSLWDLSKRSEAIAKLDQGLMLFGKSAAEAGASESEEEDGEDFCRYLKEWMQEEFDHAGSRPPSAG